jgi:hypothetical protein
MLENMESSFHSEVDLRRKHATHPINFRIPSATKMLGVPVILNISMLPVLNTLDSRLLSPHTSFDTSLLAYCREYDRFSFNNGAFDSSVYTNLKLQILHNSRGCIALAMN